MPNKCFVLKSHYPSVTKLLMKMDTIINLHINTNQPKGSEHVYLKILGKKKILKKRAWKVPWKEGSVFSISFQHCTLSHLNSAEVKRVCVWERERDQIVKKRREAMPEETTSIDYVMEAASGPHFSGLRLDGLRSSPPSSSTSSPAAHRSPVPASAFSSSSLSSALTDSNALKQPFVIGKFHFSTLKTHFHFFNFMN